MWLPACLLDDLGQCCDDAVDFFVVEARMNWQREIPRCEILRYVRAVSAGRSVTHHCAAIDANHLGAIL